MKNDLAPSKKSIKLLSFHQNTTKRQLEVKNPFVSILIMTNVLIWVKMIDKTYQMSIIVPKCHQYA